MNFDQSITLSSYSEEANKQLDSLETQLVSIESSFHTNRQWKSKASVFSSLAVTVAILAALFICALILKNHMNGAVLLITTLIVAALLLVMIVEEIMDLKYYGKMSSYRDSILHLLNRVRLGRNAVKMNYSAFMDSRKQGWDYPLKAAPSIPEEVSSVETTLSNMEALKKGFINKAKNVWFFVAAVAFTIGGSVALFPPVQDIIESLSDVYVEEGICVIAAILIAVGDVLLAKLIWSKTDCNVGNHTLIALLAGPAAFIVLSIVLTLVIMLLALVVKVVLMILAVIAAIAIAIACSSGG